MLGAADIRRLALAFEGAEESPHFEKVSFRIKKKIFATLQEEKELFFVKLTLIDQEVFHRFRPGSIAAVPNKWGQQGWTQFCYPKLPESLVQDALTLSYCAIAPATLSTKYRLQK